MPAARSDGPMTSDSGCHRAASVTVGPRPLSTAMSTGMPERGAFAAASDLMTDSSFPLRVSEPVDCPVSGALGEGAQ